MMTDHSESMDTLDLPSVDKTITSVSLAEDGWAIEVEDADGVRLTYWIAALGQMPLEGSKARFFHRKFDRRLCGLEIDGQVVFDTCQL
jgi:hypothetical protein